MGELLFKVLKEFFPPLDIGVNFFERYGDTIQTHKDDSLIYFLIKDFLQ